MEEKFYKNGLNFQCARCSKCCRHEPGYVFISTNDLKTIPSVLGISKDEFLKKYCKKIDLGICSRVTLIEKSNYDCIFWESGSCLIYENRPIQCKTYPFWSSSLESKEDWENLGYSCPGVGHGKLYTFKEIEEKLTLRKDETLLE